MKTLNKKHLLVASMAAAVLVAPTASLTAQAAPVEESSEFFLQMINENGETTNVHVDFVIDYLTTKGYTLTNAGFKEYKFLKPDVAAATAIEMTDENGQLRYIYKDSVDAYKAKGYTLTENGKDQLAGITTGETSNEGGIVVGPPAEGDGTDTGNTGGTTPTDEKPSTGDTGTVDNGDKPTDGKDPVVDKPTDEKPTTGDKPTDGKDPVVDKPTDEKPTTGDKPAVDKPTETGKDATDKAPTKAPGNIEITKIADMKITSGGENVKINLDKYFKSTTGEKLSYSIAVVEVGGDNVSTNDKNEIVINAKDVKEGSTAKVTVIASNGGIDVEQNFTITVEKKAKYSLPDGVKIGDKVEKGDKKGGAETLPQTGTETGAPIAAGLGALLIAIGAALGLRRKR